MRQRAQFAHAGARAEAATVGPSDCSGAAPRFDYARFAERFRGSEEYVKAGQQFYLPHFAELPERARYRLRTRRISGR